MILGSFLHRSYTNVFDSTQTIFIFTGLHTTINKYQQIFTDFYNSFSGALFISKFTNIVMIKDSTIQKLTFNISQRKKIKN